MYRIHQRLNLGIEWNPTPPKTPPLADLFLLMETHSVPAVSLGTSSDRIGTEAGTTSVFLTAAKRWPSPRLPLSGYVSLNWSETDDGFNYPFGGTIHIGERYGIRAMYDGQRTHLLASATWNRWTLTALWVWLEHPGVALSTGFGGETP